MRRFILILPAFCLLTLSACQRVTDTSVTDASSSAASESVSSVSPYSAPSSLFAHDTAVLQVANHIVDLLSKKDMEAIAEQYMELGGTVAFWPYANDGGTHQLTTQQMKTFFTDNAIYEWGSYDGSGEPIRLTTAAYYRRFVYDKDFAHLPPQDIAIDQTQSHGNAMSSIRETYPEAAFVNYHFIPASSENEFGWADLWIALEQKDGKWLLKAIIHDQWTI